MTMEKDESAESFGNFPNLYSTSITSIPIDRPSWASPCAGELEYKMTQVHLGFTLSQQSVITDYFTTNKPVP